MPPHDQLLTALPDKHLIGLEEIPCGNTPHIRSSMRRAETSLAPYMNVQFAREVGIFPIPRVDAFLLAIVRCV